uniref:Kinetochore protein NDC80 n=1 Tax=Syphacia muris TaxID=451379 RepID=A0A0N5AE14_9BILA
MQRYATGLQTPRNNRYSVRPPMSSAVKSATRPSYATDRFSAVGIGISSSSTRRPNSFFRTGSNVYSETRNLKDREVQRTMQGKIINFLAENEFQHPNLEKIVKSPTRSDFTRIFEFIYQQLDPRYVMKSKIEEEMPRVFQLLGYPVPLKPSTMQTIGAAHTMHILLGAITWLIDVVNVAAALEPQELLLANDDTDGQRTSLGYGYVVKCYKLMKSSNGKWNDSENFKKETENFIQIIGQ